MPIAEMTVEALPDTEVEGLRRQVDRHVQLGVTRHCAACNAYWPCAYRTSATNRLRALNIPVAGIL